MYDLTKPHMRIVGKNHTNIILQNGQAYEHGSRKLLGKVHDVVKAKTLGGQDYKLCKYCGGSFTAMEHIEEHLLKMHKDVLMTEASKFAPKGAKGIWTPTEEMLKDEAKKLSKEKETEEELVPASLSEPAKPKKSWREPK